MKKNVKLAIIVVAVISFASCKKNYTCTCTTTDPFFNPPAVYVTTTTAKSNATDAKAWCAATESTYNDTNKKNVPRESTSCSI